MTTKTVDSKGRLTLGHQFAGQLVIIDEVSPNKIVIQLAKAIPASEAWLYQNQEALNLVRQGLAEAASGAFSSSPPDVKADSAMAAEMVD